MLGSGVWCLNLKLQSHRCFYPSCSPWPHYTEAIVTFSGTGHEPPPPTLWLSSVSPSFLYITQSRGKEEVRPLGHLLSSYCSTFPASQGCPRFAPGQTLSHSAHLRTPTLTEMSPERTVLQKRLSCPSVNQPKPKGGYDEEPDST